MTHLCHVLWQVMVNCGKLIIVGWVTSVKLVEI
jgi:hypothetical protein